MSILVDFRTLVDPIMAGQAYRNVVPQEAVPPYAKFFRVAADEGLTLDENGGDDNETATRIQFDVWGESPDEVDAKIKAIKKALKSWEISNVVVLEMDDFDDSVNLHRTMLHISTIHQ